MSDKLWGGRFDDKTNKDVETFTASLKEDYRLLQADVFASKAHLHLLKKSGLITTKEETQLDEALDHLLEEYRAGTFVLLPELEDVHMNIESYLIEHLGDVGKKIHTGRSRNDQVVTAFKLALLAKNERIVQLLVELEETLIGLAETHIDIIMPGYTHMQKAQPILLAHYFQSYFEMFYRDMEKLIFFRNYLLELPLGSGALAGNSFQLDRFAAADELGFVKPTHNSMDSVADRDYALDMLYMMSLIMTHFSRLSEDLILWSTEEFGFINLSDAFTTGSSIMPQKKNPDVSELTRGKTGRVVGDLMSLFMIMKGLPMAYNRDLQEDKHVVFDACQTVEQVLKVNIGQLKTLRVNRDNIEKSFSTGFLLATDLADYLVKKGIPFREAHHILGSIVRDTEKYHKSLKDLTFEELQTYSDVFKKDVMVCLDEEHSVNARDSYGGTAKKSVKEQIKLAKKRLKEVQREG
jgi:argininosuccinate lyase